MSLKNKLCLMGALVATIFMPLFPTLAAVQKARTPKQWTLTAGTSLQIPFIENQGQVGDPAVAYYADTFACRVSVTRDGQVIYHLGHQAENQQKEPVTIEGTFPRLQYHCVRHRQVCDQSRLLFGQRPFKVVLRAALLSENRHGQH